MHYDNRHTLRPKAMRIPLRVFWAICNALPAESPLRARLIEPTRPCNQDVAAKGHIAEGFRLADAGTLVCDAALYEAAAARGTPAAATAGALDPIDAPCPGRRPALDADDVLAHLDRDRDRLPVTTATVFYEASRTHPGLIDRVTPHARTPGRFENGEFVPA